MKRSLLALIPAMALVLAGCPQEERVEIEEAPEVRPAEPAPPPPAMPPDTPAMPPDTPMMPIDTPPPQ